MASSGYKTGGENPTPDPSFWKKQIADAREFRRRTAEEANWDRWRDFYRGDWAPGVVPKNLFFSTTRTVVPRIYFRNPRVSIMPRRPGALEMAFALVLQRLTNAVLDQMRFKQQAKRMAQLSLHFGTSFGKIGLGGLFQPAFNELAGTEPSRGRAGERLEYRAFTAPQQPWFQAVHPGKILVPAGLDVWENARWIIHEIERPAEDIRNDPTFLDGARRGVTGTILEDRARSKLSEQEKAKLQQTRLFEIHDRKEGRVFVIAEAQEDRSTILLNKRDPLAEVGFPIFNLRFNEDDENFWGIPDSKIWEPHQLEMNEIRTQGVRHRRLALRKILAERGGISAEEAERLVEEDEGAVIWTEPGSGDVVKPFQPVQIPQDLQIAEQAITQDFREVSGISRNQTGEFQNRRGDTSATEAQAVQAATDIRLDERRDAMADMVLEVVQVLHQIIFRQWTDREVIDVVGPEGNQVWVQFNPSTLRLGQYVVKVDPDSAAPRTRQVRESRAVQLFQLLSQNPLANPEKLSRYFLAQFGDVELDDILQSQQPVQQPGAPGGAAGQPVGLEGLAQQLQGAPQGQPVQ